MSVHGRRAFRYDDSGGPSKYFISLFLLLLFFAVAPDLWAAAPLRSGQPYAETILQHGTDYSCVAPQRIDNLGCPCPSHESENTVKRCSIGFHQYASKGMKRKCVTFATKFAHGVEINGHPYTKVCHARRLR